MFVVAIEQGGPLFWADPQSCLHRHADDLGIMLTTKGLIGAELRGRGGGGEGEGGRGGGEREGGRGGRGG